MWRLILVGLVGWCSLESRAAATPLTWLWANPMPHGNHLYDMAYGRGMVLQVGDSGQAYASLDLDLWVPCATGTDRALRGVTFFNDRPLITGQAGTVLRGTTNTPPQFTRVELPTTDWLEGVAASTSLAVAVGDNGAIYTSPDGLSWTRRPQAFSTWLRSVAYGAGIFVAVGESGFIAGSTDGLLWRLRTSGVSENLNRVVYQNSRFFVVGDAGRVLVSATAGATWSVVQKANAPTNSLFAIAGVSEAGGGALLVAGARELRTLESGATAWVDQTSVTRAAPAPSWTYYSALWDGALFLAGGRAGMVTAGHQTNAAAPLAWVTASDSIRQWLWDVACFPGLYVAVGDLGTILTSPNGVDWDLELTPASVTNSVLLGVGGRPDCLVAVGNYGAMLVSTNSVVWSAVEPRPTDNDLQGIASFGHLLVAAGGGGTILTSTNGCSWGPASSRTTATLTSLAAYPGGLVAVGENGTILTSPDAIRWSAVASATTNWLYRVRYLEGQLIAVGQNGAILASANGSSWTRQTTSTGAWLTDVTALDGKFYAVGAQGAVLVRTDAGSWTNVAVISQTSLYSAVAAHHQIVAVGTEGAILRAQGRPVNLLQYSRPQGTNVFLLSGRPGHQFSLEQGLALPAFTTLTNLQFLDNSGAAAFVAPGTADPPRAFFRARAAP